MNTIPKMVELQFEEKTHQYKLDGIVIPSVSAVMRPLSSAFYKDVDEKILSMAASRGTQVHNAIENYALYGIEDIDPKYEKYFEAYLEWESEYKPNLLANECRVYHKFLRYAGTADLLAEIDGKLYLIDFKTSASVNKMLTGVQLEAYAKAFETHGLFVDKKAILHLKKDGKYEFILYDKNDIESWGVFGSLMVVYNHIKKYKGGSK